MDILLYLHSQVLILVNRRPNGFSSPQKGLRKGDALSPFLFILGMEELTQLLDRAKELQWTQGFQVGGNSNTSGTASHLLYADNTLIFCGADSQQVNHLNMTLMVFESTSGLHINILNSKI